jgi:hypothetical protein
MSRCHLIVCENEKMRKQQQQLYWEHEEMPQMENPYLLAIKFYIFLIL